MDEIAVQSAGHKIHRLKKISLYCGIAVFMAIFFSVYFHNVQTSRLKAWQLEYRRSLNIPFPPENPFSDAKVELGRKLFFEPLLSASGTQACVTCHRPDLAWGDGLPRAVGDDGGIMSLRSPTLINVAWTPKLGWTGKFRDIEAVTFAAITSKKNMNLPESEAIKRLKAVPAYARAFATAFNGGDITPRNVELALATYQRTILSGEAPFDRWIEGDETAISSEARRGFVLFNDRAGCAACHSAWAFSDGSFHDIGTAQGADIGRGELFPNSVRARYAFKVPTLRDVAHRAPYMHDGSIPTLEAVIDLYDRGGISRPSRSSLIKPLNLSKEEKYDLLAFLRTLTSPTPSAK